MGVTYPESTSVFAFGPHQTNYTTPVAPDDDPKNYRLVVKDGYEKPSYSDPNVPNTGKSTGLALPDKTRKDRAVSGFTAVEELTFQLLGIRAYDAFGVAATPEVVVADEVWKHIFSLLDAQSGATLQTRPLAYKVGESASAANKILDAELRSMMYQRLTITNSAADPSLVADSEWIGSGELIEDYADILASDVKFWGGGRHVWHESDIAAAHKTNINKLAALIKIYPQVDFGGTPVNSECILDTFNLTINENVELNYNCARFQDGDPTKAAIAGSGNSSGQTVGFEATVQADSEFVQTLDIYERIKSGTPFSITIEFDGGEIGSSGENHMALFKINRTTIDDHSWVPALGKQGIRFVTSPLASGNSFPLSLELQTNVANFSSYIAA